MPPAHEAKPDPDAAQAACVSILEEERNAIAAKTGHPGFARRLDGKRKTATNSGLPRSFEVWRRPPLRKKGTKNGGGFISKLNGYLNFWHKCEKRSVDTTSRTQVAVPPDRRLLPSKIHFLKLVPRIVGIVHHRRIIKKWYPFSDTTSPMRDFQRKSTAKTP